VPPQKIPLSTLEQFVDARFSLVSRSKDKRSLLLANLKEYNYTWYPRLKNSLKTPINNDNKILSMFSPSNPKFSYYSTMYHEDMDRMRVKVESDVLSDKYPCFTIKYTCCIFIEFDALSISILEEVLDIIEGFNEGGFDDVWMKIKKLKFKFNEIKYKKRNIALLSSDGENDEIYISFRNLLSIGC
jgi:hypothetical protein